MWASPLPQMLPPKPSLQMSAIFHDLGLTEKFNSPHKRFEVDGANAARSFLEQQGISKAKIQIVSDVIALHTTIGVAQYKEPEVMVEHGLGLEPQRPKEAFLPPCDMLSSNRCEALAKRWLRGWRTWQDSNPQPLDPKSSALSIELQVQMKDGARHREHYRDCITCVNPALV